MCCLTQGLTPAHGFFLNLAVSRQCYRGLGQGFVKALAALSVQARALLAEAGLTPADFEKLQNLAKLSGEEACELAEAGMPFEIVPGVTAGFGAAIYAGIPLTHRDYTTSLGLITGHEDPTKKVSSLDWSKLATDVGTLLFYMGMGNLATITRQLMAHGRSSETPVAVIRWGTTPRQQTVIGSLADIADKVVAGTLPPHLVAETGAYVPVTVREFDYSRDGDLAGEELQKRLVIGEAVRVTVE